MEILLVVPRYNLTNKKNYKYDFPFGLGYISSVLKKAHYNVDCLNLNHHNGTVKEILKSFLDKKKYDFVCTGHMGIGYHMIKNIVDSVRTHPSSPKIIIGGAIIISEPELMFNSLKPDFAVIGEGEITIIELLDSIKKNNDLKKVDGIMYLDDNGNLVVTKKREPIKDLDFIPFPDFEGLGFEEKIENSYTNESFHSNILDNPRAYPILCSRGCPFKCTFCYHPLGEGYRMRTIKNIIKELEWAMKKYRINIFSFYDEIFAVNKERLFELCKEIKNLTRKFPWESKWACQLTVQNVDEETLKMLKDSGCILVSYGFESFSSEVLRSMKKPITPEQIDSAIKLTRKVGLALSGNFIFGDVAETKDTAYKTLDYWEKNCYGQVNMDFVQPYPGSEIYRHCIRKGLIKDKLEFIKNIGIQNSLNMTNSMTDEDMSRLKMDITRALAMHRYRNSAQIIYMKKKSKYLYNLKIKCPFCKEKIEYQNFRTKNKLYFVNVLICRNCYMHFIVTSSVKSLIYRFYSVLYPLMGYYVKIRNRRLKKEV